MYFTFLSTKKFCLNLKKKKKKKDKFLFRCFFFRKNVERQQNFEWQTRRDLNLSFGNLIACK